MLKNFNARQSIFVFDFDKTLDEINYAKTDEYKALFISEISKAMKENKTTQFYFVILTSLLKDTEVKNIFSSSYGNINDYIDYYYGLTQKEYKDIKNKEKLKMSKINKLANIKKNYPD